MNLKEIKWCTGCGNYSILKQIEKVFNNFCIKKENIVFVSGIGCSSRLPYYTKYFGIHGIHGRAISIAIGIKLSNPKLSVWVITGDGDGLSIGGNHLIHALRRNIDINILLFNNEVYALTKGQSSPTTKKKFKNKYDNYNPINTLLFSLGCNATFIARSIDRNPKHLRKMLYECFIHKGTSFLEIYQNCNIFNNNAFNYIENKKKDKIIFIEEKKPFFFGKKKAIIINNYKPYIINDININNNINNIWIHDQKNLKKSFILSNFFYKMKNFPCPFGIIYKKY